MLKGVQGDFELPEAPWAHIFLILAWPAVCFLSHARCLNFLIWAPSWEAFGVVLATFPVQEGTRSAKVDFQKKACKICRFLMILRVGGVQTVPFWVPEATFGSLEKRITFCIDFGCQQ